jgi:hypothetical protein
VDAHLVELERCDAAAAAVLADVEELQHTVDLLRARARAVAEFQAALPAEREWRRGAIAAADVRLRAAESARESAETELARAEKKRGEEQRAKAARAAAEAREDVRVAEGELTRARDAAAALEAEADQTAAEAASVRGDAETAAARLAALPRLTPLGALDDVETWGARARGALLVLHGSLAAERDAIVREANELGSALLGEPLGATSVTGVRERVERALQTGPP